MARSERVGVPIDMEIFPDLADKKTWREMRDSMVPLVDVHGVYVRDKFGEWHVNIARFEEWTASEGIKAVCAVQRLPVRRATSWCQVMHRRPLLLRALRTKNSQCVPAHRVRYRKREQLRSDQTF